MELPIDSKTQRLTNKVEGAAARRCRRQTKLDELLDAEGSCCLPSLSGLALRVKLALAKRSHKKATRKLLDHLASEDKLAEAGLEAVAPLVSHLNGVALRDLDYLVETSDEVLGQGGFGCVAAVDIAGCPPLCVKTIFNEDLMEDTLREAEYMFSLRDVAGLPRVLGISQSPLAILMSRHGKYTFMDVAMGSAEGLEVSLAQVFQGFSLLTYIL